MLQFFKKSAATVAAAAANKVRLFIDTDGLPKTKDELGAVVVLGNGISSVALIDTVGLVDNYRITLQNGDTFDYSVTNAKSITGVALVSTNVLVKTYRISFNDGTNVDYMVSDGRGISNIESPANPGAPGATDTYTIRYSDGTTSTYVVYNGVDGNDGIVNSVNGISQPNIVLTAADVGAIATTEKGAANGVATLGADSKIPANQLPSYVDDVVEFATLAAFPATGETGKIYVALDNGKTYRWSGSTYVEISASEVNSVNGQTGVVVLTTANVAENTNLYFTAQRVRDVVLTGLSLVTGGAITATDTVLGAFGKLQKQLTDHFNAADPHPIYTTSTEAQTIANDAVATHVGLADPHTQYTTATEAAAAAPVQSVFGRTGSVSAVQTDYSAATTTVQGMQSAADKARQDNLAKFQVNILDFGADPTGATSSRTALTNAIAALPAAGGVVNFPAGEYNLGNTAFALAKAHVTLRGAARYNTAITTTSLTEDILQVTEFYCNVEDLTFRGPFSTTVEFPTKTAGVGINATTGGAYTMIRRCSFQAMFIGIRLGNPLASIDDVEVRYFKESGIVVDHNSDHQIRLAIMDNNTGALPTGGGIRVLQTASLLVSDCNIIHANFCLDVAPATGVTIPSIKGVNCFFDTSAVGLNMTTAGSFFRSEFTNCWFSSMSVAGVRLAPTTANGVDGVTFVNCDIYNNVAGTTNGILIGSANVGKIKVIGCSIAGWTNGINLIAGASFFPTISNNSIGAIAAFAANSVGILVAAGTYKGLVITGNDVADNTTALTLGAVTTTVASYERITDNAGINPRGTELRPVATPALATLYTNNTGFKVHIHVKHGATANTGIILNGVTITATYVAAQIATYVLEPGGTIQFTGGTAPTVWSWVGM